MSKWLTTGEMIDQLKVGEVAETNEQAGLRVKYTKECGLIYVNEHEVIDLDNGKEGRVFITSDYIKNMKWRILPNYVSFEEAMKAGKEGKTIAYHTQYDKHVIEPMELRQFAVASLSIQDNGLLHMFEGKWTIENV
ncbi:hypothetical protein [Virgibacillus sp. Bac332]|uniref:hypothetical protein n=1 Tax=Virgibacillus sp. Bac332 TaxID=2419842 RepID=UPI000EF4D1E5|nr:hypothetical protein [Virgibacillus sp. Bac332]